MLLVSGVGIVKVVIKNIVCDFIIKMYIVVVYNVGFRNGKQCMNVFGESGFVFFFFMCFLWCDVGNQYCVGLWQIIIGGFVIKYFWFVNNVEVVICMECGELCRFVEGWMCIEGFVIVEEECVLYVVVFNCYLMYMFDVICI